MSIQYGTLEDELFSMFYALEKEPDIMLRLKFTYMLSTMAHVKFRDMLEKTAYEARLKYSSQDIEQIVCCQRQQIDYWAKRHAYRRDLPPVRKRKRRDLSEYMDLRDLTGR